jgi:hypothetical protein
MSAALSRSIRRMRPVASASTSTLFATCAATNSADRENCSCTLSTLKMGSEVSPGSCKLVEPTKASLLGLSGAMAEMSRRPACHTKTGSRDAVSIRGASLVALCAVCVVEAIASVQLLHGRASSHARRAG